jgi:DNA (cytosine-5)-methyltransferase 1
MDSVWDDISTFSYSGDVDLVTGGFPCQDISIAGKGEGIEGERSGLWTEFKRVISEIRPRFALIENVPALTFRGLDRVLCDLAEIGYDAEWQCISASEVGAWHKRERIWIIAYPTSSRFSTGGYIQRGRNILSEVGKTEESKQAGGGWECRIGKVHETNSNAPSKRLEGEMWKVAQGIRGGFTTQDRGQSEPWNENWYEVATEFCRVAHGIPDRIHRLKSLGNAIVPQVAYIIMQQIKRVLDGNL